MHLEAQLEAPDGSLPARAEAWLGHVIEAPAAALVVGEVAVLLAGVVMRFVFKIKVEGTEIERRKLCCLK